MKLVSPIAPLKTSEEGDSHWDIDILFHVNNKNYINLDEAKEKEDIQRGVNNILNNQFLDSDNVGCIPLLASM